MMMMIMMKGKAAVMTCGPFMCVVSMNAVQECFHDVFNNLLYRDHRHG